MKWPFRRVDDVSGRIDVSDESYESATPQPVTSRLQFGMLASLSGWLYTPCPLCLGPSRHGKMCRGCLDDTYEVRQSRRVCLGCADDLLNNPYSKGLPSQANQVTRCQACARRSCSFDWFVCAFDAGFPIDLMLDRFSGPRSSLSLAPVIADCLIRALSRQIQQDAWRGSCWVPVPPSFRRLQRCECSPSRELAYALRRLTTLPVRDDLLSRYEHSFDGEIKTRFEADTRVKGLSVTLVLDQIASRDLIESAADALRVAGAQQIGVVCAAYDATVWHNHAHVSCDPG